MMIHRRSQSATVALVVAVLVAACATTNTHAFTAPQSRIRSPSHLLPPTQNLLFLGPSTTKRHQRDLQQQQHLQLLLLLNAKSNGADRDRAPPLGFWKRLEQAAAAARTDAVGKVRRARRAASTAACAAALFLLAALGPWNAPARAAALPAALPSIERVLPSASLDRMVDRYVVDHMFDDDVYDPVESAYRETYDDITTGTYPNKLKDVTASVLGKDAAAVAAGGSDSSGGGGGNFVIAAMERSAKLLTRFVGVTEQTAQIILAVATMAGAFFSFVLVFGGTSVIIKTGMNREMKRRYGDDFTMDASSIKEPSPVVDEDDDDDNDDDDNDDDEDDDNDEDDDDDDD